ncbi:Uncharacterised protein [Yokenella regensburgei]|nr:Uncharacterised protein [Yokenella regensburgei]
MGIARALNVGLAYQTMVGGMMNTSVAMMQSSQVGLDKSLMVGMGYSVNVGTTSPSQWGKQDWTVPGRQPSILLVSIWSFVVVRPGW